MAIGPPRKHLDALVLVLLAKGEPMDLDEIVGVLAPVWDGTPRDLKVTLQKARAGRAPVVKDADGRYALDLDSIHMNRSWSAWACDNLHLRADHLRSRPEPEVSLISDELRACFVRRCPSGVSGARFAAAVLDMVGRPMLPSEVAALGEAWMLGSLPEPQPSPRRTIDGLVVEGEDGPLALNPAAAAELAAMRRRIRELALPRTPMAAETAWSRELAKQIDESPHLNGVWIEVLFL